jgi:hypothetical protein
MLYAQSPVSKAAICTAVYPGSTILLSLAVQAAPLPDSIRELLGKPIAWLLWPVRAIAMGVMGLIDRAASPGLDEPASMFLPQWQYVGLVAVSVLLTGALVFVSSLTLFRWLQSKR